MRFIKWKAIAFLAIYMIAFMGFTSEACSQEIDYIKIVEPPGNNRVPGPCTRLQGTGLPQYYARFRANGWNNGPNGIPEDGGGDDILVGPVNAFWGTRVGPELGTIDRRTGVFTAAVSIDCGEGLVGAFYRHFREGEGWVLMRDLSSIAVIPPDWLPDVPLQDLSKVGSDKESR